MPQVATAIVERGEPVGGDALQTDAPWWSFGKTVIAAAALALVEQGRLNLDAPLAGEAFTLRQLLQHRAGLRDYGELADYHAAVARADPPWSPAEFLARVGALPGRPPGTTWAYSNIGYYWVALEIERGFGGSLAAALEALVIGPLDIPGVRLVTGPQVPMHPGYDGGWVLHGLLAGPISSAALLLDRLLAGRLLRPPRLAEMLEGHPLPQFSRGAFVAPAYGLGLMMPGTSAGQVMRGHTGGGPGSTIAVYRLGERTVAAFAQTEDQTVVETAAYELASGA